MTLNTEI